MPIAEHRADRGRSPDYYHELGLRPTATVDQVKAAYRRQALKYHPDKNPSSAAAVAKFQVCTEAYSILSDPERRAVYDRSRGGRGVQELARDLIGDILGARRQRPLRGRDLRYTLELSFKEAAQGFARPIHFSVIEDCAACRGSGAAPGGSRPCFSCAGRGEIRDRQGLLGLARPCARCGGQGIATLRACTTCGGSGTLERAREYVVTIQPGARDGDTKIVSGEGEPGSGGGRSGDLIVRIKVRPHPLFNQEGKDLRAQVPVAFALAAIGGTVEVPTLDGKVRMRIPPGTQSGRIFRLRGKGLPRPAGKAGDLLVEVAIETPVTLTAAQRQLLEELERLCDAKSCPLQAAYTSRLKALEDEP